MLAKSEKAAEVLDMYNMLLRFATAADLSSFRMCGTDRDARQV